MKNRVIIFLLSLVAGTGTFARNGASTPNKAAADIKSKKHLSSSFLLRMRTDKPRQAGMDRWKGPHSKVISATKGMEKYRPIYLAENNPGLWQPIPGVETTIPADRKTDGVANVSLKNIFSLFRGKKQTKLAFRDEVNLFKRTILCTAPDSSSRWYEIARPGAKIDARSIVFFRMKDGVDKKDFKTFIFDELTPALANTGVLQELRRKVYMPWKEKQWDTPNVAHDNPEEVQFQASVMLGFTDKEAMETIFKSDTAKKLSDRLAVFRSARHSGNADLCRRQQTASGVQKIINQCQTLRSPTHTC